MILTINYLSRKSALVLLLSISLVGVILYSINSNAKQCQLDNKALKSMPEIEIKFESALGELLKIKAKLADNAQTRAAGFQRVCASTIETSPILFVFERESIPRFHMRNVVAPIDIAFIKGDGVIDSIQAMATYVMGSKSRPLYSPRQPVIAALEVSPGFYSKNGINEEVKVSWITY